MKFHILTLFPDSIFSAVHTGVVGQAIDKNIIEIENHNPRDFTTDGYRSVDDRPFGGGDGMIMLPEVLEKTIKSIPNFLGIQKIYLSPQGKKFDDRFAQKLSQQSEVILICGRYGGIDQRFIHDFVDEEISIGDFVLSGGELAAAVVIDCIARKIPGVLGDAVSAERDSFHDLLLEEPLFTRPRSWNDMSVPEALLTGNHAKIEKWRKSVARLVTLKKRPDLFWQSKYSKKDLISLSEFLSQLPAQEKDLLGLSDLQDSDFDFREKL